VSKRIPLPEAARLFRALGDPTRLRLLLLLSERGEVGVNDLARAAGLAQTAMNYHLKGLRRAGVVAWRREGRRRYYRFASPLAGELLRDVGPG
jgi:DNA-binding transcriptional ArsR family regulator